MKIIVGLGNVGEQYASNRHNCGFMVVDKFAEELGVEFKHEQKFEAFTAEAEYKDEKVILAKPTTLMNRSGGAVSKLINFYKTQGKNLVVIYDDIDLPLGTIRIRKKGSAGTHNGMKSIIGETGKQVFPRIKLGIESRGVTAPKLQNLTSFVLSNFSSKESKILEESVDSAITELKILIKE
jgi:peptidyl-tRNA hydrolase, PTH1 family